MSPRELRKAMKEGRWTATVGPRSLPLPPEEWSHVRRKRLSVAIRCAQFFIFHGYTWVDVLRRVAVEERSFNPRSSKQRVSQYIDRGVKFLLSRGVFVAVKQKAAAGSKPGGGK